MICLVHLGIKVSTIKCKMVAGRIQVWRVQIWWCDLNDVHSSWLGGNLPTRVGNLYHMMGHGARLLFLERSGYKGLWKTFSCPKRKKKERVKQFPAYRSATLYHFIFWYGKSSHSSWLPLFTMSGFIILCHALAYDENFLFSFFVGVSDSVYWKLQWVLWICYRCWCCCVFDAGEWYDSWALSRGCFNWWRCMFFTFIYWYSCLR